MCCLFCVLFILFFIVCLFFSCLSFVVGFLLVLLLLSSSSIDKCNAHTSLLPDYSLAPTALYADLQLRWRPEAVNEIGAAAQLAEDQLETTVAAFADTAASATVPQHQTPPDASPRTAKRPRHDPRQTR